MIKILKIEKNNKREDELGGGWWLKIWYKNGEKGRKIKTAIIHESNINEKWELSGLALQVFGENITHKVGSRVYSN